jgi:hypothetical protein
MGKCLFTSYIAPRTEGKKWNTHSEPEFSLEFYTRLWMTQEQLDHWKSHLKMGDESWAIHPWKSGHLKDRYSTRQRIYFSQFSLAIVVATMMVYVSGTSWSLYICLLPELSKFHLLLESWETFQNVEWFKSQEWATYQSKGLVPV